MKKLKSGSFTQTFSLNNGQEYEFKYLINKSIWINDPKVDKHSPNGIGEYNSVITV
jgi:hypothetical protein